MLKLLKSASPEDLFIQRYDRLIGRALALTGGNRALAEDLVHDAFIQFTLRRSELGAIENTDAYLNRMLRNMYLSQIRRATLIQDSPFSIANFDSAEIGLRNIDPRERVDVQDDLRQICQYACARKEGSKAGCVLILRFFHGYYPSEIAAILRTSRKAVDRYLLISRREAKLYLSDPGALKFTAGLDVENARTNVSQLGYVRTTSGLLAELRDTIFASRKGECSTAEQLKELYRKTSGAVDVTRLSHVVSCRRCLDGINGLLGLLLLAERNSDDRLGRDVPPDKSGGGEGGDVGGGGSVVDSRRRYQRRLRETIEHRPQELRIAVNGFVLGAQEVSSEFNKQVLTVNIDEPIGFIEVFSEQGLRLLFFDVDQPIDGSVEQTASAEFDCGRELDLSLNFRGPWPSLNVAYHDPTFEAVESYMEDLNSEISGEAEVQSRDGSPVLREGFGRGPLAKARGALKHFVNKRKDLHLPTWDFGLLLRPATITALFALVLLLAVVLIYRRTPPPLLLAADLLQRAVVSEDAIAANRDQVLHRTLQLEEKSASGRLLSTRRIEIWHSAEKGITARRLYDENGSLVAGDWRRADGVQAIYHHGKRPELRLEAQKPVDAPIDFDGVWLLDPSAKAFTFLVGDSQNAQAQAGDNSYLISYGSANASSPGLVSASLVLGRADLHALQQTLIVRQGSEIREYRFTETSFERRSPSSVAPAVFEPNVELIGAKLSESGPVATGSNSNTEAPPPNVAATTADEVEVLNRLHQIGADITEQLNVTRTADGRLLVEGLVETDKRKQEILNALAPVRNNPAIRIKIQTLEEATRALERQKEQANQMGPGTVERVEVEKGKLAVDTELRAYFERNSSNGGETDEKIRAFVSRVINRSKGAAFQASALNRMANRFNADQLKALDPAARAKYLGMLRGYAAAVRRETAALRGELQPVFGDVSDGGGESVTSDADLIASARRLFELASQNDRVIRSAFTMSSGGASVSAIKSGQFRRSLGQAESLAAAIERAR